MADVQQLQQEVQALQAQLQQLNQLQQQQQQQQQPAPAPPQFALSPALANIGILDYNTAEGSNIYKQAVKPLKDEFDCTPGGLNVLLAQLKDRASAYGWTRILNIPPNMNAPITTINIIDGYGQLTLAQVRTHAATYVNQESRQAQDSSQMYLCLMSTLTSKGKNQIMLRQRDYTIGDQASGTCLLKVIIQESYVDSNATVSVLRQNLTNLASYMQKVDSDIVEFNNYVDTQVEALAARGQTTNDLLTNLFIGYKAASDKKFVEYIEHKEEAYEDGEDMTPTALMRLARNKYKTRKDREIWKAPTEEDEKIIALEAELKRVKEASNKDKKGRANKGLKSPKKKGKGKNNKKPDWMLIPPKEGQSSSKTVNNKLYHWCSRHKAWTRHKPADCRGRNVPASQGNNATSTDSNSDTERKLKLEHSLAAIAEDDEESL